MVDPKKLYEELKTETFDKSDEFAERLKELVEEEAPRFREDLANSFMVVPNENGGHSIISTLDYAIPIQRGTKPFSPPIKPLKVWVKKQLGEPTNVAYAVRSKIESFGIDANPYITRAVRRLENEVV